MFRLLVVAIALNCVSALRAWDYDGHRMVNELALGSLPENFPTFVKTPAARERIAFLGGEPDRWRNSTNLATRHFLAPEHFLDLEDLTPHGLTPQNVSPFRYEFAVQLANGRKEHARNFEPIDPAKNSDHTRELAGFLPWSINDHFAKLESAFSSLKVLEQGGTPDEIANAQQNVIYYMGVFGHFVGDAAQPLHTTKHYNGWVGPNPKGYTTNRTFHSWIDGGYIKRANITAASLRARVRPAKALWSGSPTNAFGEAMKFIQQQFELVEPLYALDRDGKLSPRNQSDEGRKFIEEQLLKGAQFLGDLWYSAWLHAPQDKWLMNELERRKTAQPQNEGK